MWRLAARMGGGVGGMVGSAGPPVVHERGMGAWDEFAGRGGCRLH